MIATDPDGDIQQEESSSMPPTNQSLEDRVRRKVRRVFYERTHRGSKIDVRVEKEMQKYKTIIAPYEPTVEQLTKIALTITREVCENLIGSNERLDINPSNSLANTRRRGRNTLRREQKQRLANLLGDETE